MATTAALPAALPAPPQPAPTSPVEQLRKALERKATFASAVQQLTAGVKAGSLGAEELGVLVPRVHALLKTRYTGVTFWQAGVALFRATHASCRAPAGLQAKLPGFMADAEAFVAAGLEEDGADEQQQRQQTLGELLLGLPPPAPAQSHLSDAGLVLDTHPGPAAAAAAGPPPAFAAAAAAAAEGHDGGDADAAATPTAADGTEVTVLSVLRQLALQQQQQQQQQEPHEQQQQQQQQGGSAATAAGAAAVEQQAGGQHPASLEAMLQVELLHSNRAELEALLVSLVEQQTAGQAGGSVRPAASKAAVAQLPVVHVDSAAALEALGGPGSTCPVCTDEYTQGDCVQRLPCKHTFHVSCLAPWLMKDNSCPVCRHELPTDDFTYEHRKEAAAEAEAEARGAANALSHNEFAYV